MNNYIFIIDIALERLHGSQKINKINLYDINHTNILM